MPTPISQEALEDQAEMAMIYFVHLATEHFKETIKPIPILYNLKGQTIGQAWGGKSEVPYLRLNAPMLRDNPDEIIPTVGHEVAHVITGRFYPGSRAHGFHWSGIMTFVFKLSPERTHSVPTAKYAAKRAIKKWRYHCPCGTTYSLGKKRHTNIQNGWRDYTCANCGTNLRTMRFETLNP